MMVDGIDKGEGVRSWSMTWAKPRKTNQVKRVFRTVYRCKRLCFS